MFSLHIIDSLTDPLLALIKDDPVRPEIPTEFRVTAGRRVFVLLDDYGKPAALVCAVFRDTLPRTVEELGFPNVVDPTHCVFYTIWSYQPGTGRELITRAVAWVKLNVHTVHKFVTLSPPTEMARKFHLRNGARVLAENTDTVNYEYQ